MWVIDDYVVSTFSRSRSQRYDHPVSGSVIFKSLLLILIISKLEPVTPSLLIPVGLEQAMGYADLQERLLEEVSVWARTPGTDGARPGDDPRVREQLAQTAIHAEVGRLLRHRSTWLSATGLPLGGKGAMTKSFSAATYLEDAQAWAELAGPHAMLGLEEPHRVAGAFFEEILRQTPVNTIYGGTVEILRSLVAELELGLPKSR
jgi:alkylation response protein AidB-like acyl-CoA dehydrogenase